MPLDPETPLLRKGIDLPRGAGPHALVRRLELLIMRVNLQVASLARLIPRTLSRLTLRGLRCGKLAQEQSVRSPETIQKNDSQYSRAVIARMPLLASVSAN